MIDRDEANRVAEYVMRIIFLAIGFMLIGAAIGFYMVEAAELSQESYQQALSEQDRPVSSSTPHSGRDPP